MDNEYYYLDENFQPQGPMSFEALTENVNAGRLSAQVLVAQKGATQWVTFATLATQLGNEGYEALPSAPAARAEAAMPKPDSNLVWAILCTLLCCLPLGIVAIIKASSVDGLYAQGRYEEARQASVAAREWSLWGAVVWIVVLVICLLDQ